MARVCGHNDHEIVISLDAPEPAQQEESFAMRSDTIKRGFERAPHRSLLRATGQIRDEADFDKPFIAICNSYVDIIPGRLGVVEREDVAPDASVAVGSLVPRGKEEFLPAAAVSNFIMSLHFCFLPERFCCP